MSNEEITVTQDTIKVIQNAAFLEGIWAAIDWLNANGSGATATTMSLAIGNKKLFTIESAE